MRNQRAIGDDRNEGPSREGRGAAAIPGRARLRPMLMLASTLLAGTPVGLSEPPPAELHWRNGDALSGRLLPSDAGEVRWSSPLFLDDLIVDPEVLDAITFLGQTISPNETFRVGTVSGDVFLADLISSDDEAFVFSSPLFGQARVSRDRVYALQRLTHPNLIFDGSQSSAWGVAVAEGPIKNLTYRIYDGRDEWPRWIPGEVPEVSRLIPVADGAFAAGYLDLGLAELTDEFAMVFAGQLEVAREGDYRFALAATDSARLFVDGMLIGLSSSASEAGATVKLDAGLHALRLEYGKTLDAQAPSLKLSWAGPGFSGQSLVGINPPPGWRRGLGGHLQTERPKASIFRGIDLPESFEIDLELSSTESPRFVFALGGDASNMAAPQPLRLETWDEELVLVQDTLFEPVTTMAVGQHDVVLRLRFESESRALTVFDSEGRALMRLSGVRPAVRRSGLFLRNRGKDLTVRCLSVYRRPSSGERPPVDVSRPRVHLMDGQILYGRLDVGAGAAAVVAQDGTRRNVDSLEIDRVVRPDAEFMAVSPSTELDYTHGAVLRGDIERTYSDRVVLRTAFSEAPLACTLTGAVSLRFGGAASEQPLPPDQLVSAAGRLRGELSFEQAESPFGWRPDGVAKAVRVDIPGGARIERGEQTEVRLPLVDIQAFPQVLHLRNGEVFPGRVESLSEGAVVLQSPWIQRGELDAAQLKAIEFNPWVETDAENALSSEVDTWFRQALRPKESASLGVDLLKLDRALTVPRFSREDPPQHILVAKTGDLLRGNLRLIADRNVQFETRLRRVNVPADRMTAVVDVSASATEQSLRAAWEGNTVDRIRVMLADGSVFVFNALASKDGRLWGRSPVYGDLWIPTAGIRRLVLNDFEQETFKSRFDEWVVHPAKEPEYSQPSPADRGRTDTQEKAAPAVVSFPVLPDHPANADSPTNTARTVEPASPAGAKTERGAPDLGLVRVDPVDRSLRFPVSVNQRAGLVEYALVTAKGKTHESVFRTDAEPTHIHLGLLLLGGQPVYARQFSPDPSRKPPGDPVLIEVAWTADGVEVRKPLEDFVVSTNTSAALTKGSWTYNGSFMLGNGLVAQAEGSIVSLYLDPSALVNNPRPDRDNDEAHRVNTPVLPEEAAGLAMIIRPASDEVRRANRPESENPNLGQPLERHDAR